MFRKDTIRGRSGMDDAISGATFESWFNASPMISNCLDGRLQEVVPFVVGERPAAAEVLQQLSSPQAPIDSPAGHAAYRFSRFRMTSSRKYGLRIAVIVTTSTGRSRIRSRPSFRVK